MGQDSRKERDKPHHRRSSCFPHRAGAPENVNRASTAAGREARRRQAQDTFAGRTKKNDRTCQGRRVVTRADNRQSRKPKDFGFFRPPTLTAFTAALPSHTNR